MLKLIIILVDKYINQQKILELFQEVHYKIVLMRLLEQKVNIKNSNLTEGWHELFIWQEEFNRVGLSVSISTVKGSLFNIINTIHSLEADLLIISKHRFLTLASDEFEDFLEQINCPIVLV